MASGVQQITLSTKRRIRACRYLFDLFILNAEKIFEKFGPISVERTVGTLCSLPQIMAAIEKSENS